jgi:hypothetical protein
MARIPERKFDPSRPVVARKYFTANGRKYAPGAPLDWRSASISQRRVMQMFDAGKLIHNDKMDVIERVNAPEVTVEDNPLESLDYYTDDLDAIDDMKELRRIADSEGAPYKVSKADQRQAIRDHRNKETN